MKLFAILTILGVTPEGSVFDWKNVEYDLMDSNFDDQFKSMDDCEAALVSRFSSSDIDGVEMRRSAVSGKVRLFYPHPNGQAHGTNICAEIPVPPQ